MNSNKFHDIKTVYFDYDGTLHNSKKIYVPSFKKAYEYLVSEKQAEPIKFYDDEIAKWLGYTDEEMWKIFMKDLDIKYKKRAEEILKSEMENQMISGNAELFKNIPYVLQHLKAKGYTLVFLSNCMTDYMQSAKRIFHLDKYFDDMHCAQLHGNKQKEEVLRIIKNNYPEKQVLVGDRFHDIKAANDNNILSIFCLYGYGDISEGKDATVSVKNPIEILNYI